MVALAETKKLFVSNPGSGRKQETDGLGLSESMKEIDYVLIDAKRILKNIYVVPFSTHECYGQEHI